MVKFIVTGVLVAVASYLLGSINFAVILSRCFAKDDVRTHGSGNAGMTNMLRTYGKRMALFTGIGDFSKGLIAVLLARLVLNYWLGIVEFDAGYIGGLSALIGHIFPIYFGFKGGKGVLTSLGIILVINPLAFFILAVIFVPLVFITRIVSLGSILGALSFPIITYILLVLQHKNPWIDTIMAAVFALIVVFMHRENIKRLLSGTENRFQSKKNKQNGGK